MRSRHSQFQKFEAAFAVLAPLAFGLLLISITSSANDQREPAAVAPAVRAVGLVPLRPEDRNSGSYMREIEANVPAEKASLNAMIFDKKIADEMAEKFNSYDKPYQARQAYQLNRIEDSANYQQSSRDLAEWTIKKLLQYHFENTLRKNAEQAVAREAKESKSESTRAAAQAVQTIANVQKALQESTMNFGKDTKTKFHYDFPSGQVQVGLTSPVVDAAVNYHMASVNPQVGVANQGTDKLNLGVSRNLEFIKASTSFHYGILGQINYGVNKQLVGPLSAAIDQSHNVRDNSKDETVFRVNFGTRF